VAYGEYALKKLSVVEWHRWFKEGREDGQSKTQRTDAYLERLKIRCETNSRRIEYE
jgi:hypothetical protein